jgi:hypothetical protein
MVESPLAGSAHDTPVTVRVRMVKSQAVAEQDSSNSRPFLIIFNFVESEIWPVFLQQEFMAGRAD